MTQGSARQHPTATDTRPGQVPAPVVPHQAPTARGWLILILLVGTALRMAGLGSQELRGDEAFGYFFQQSSFAQIVSDTVTLQEPHPVASYFLQKGWLTVAGTSEFALRFSGVWFSVLAIALLYRLARSLHLSQTTSLLAAGTLAASPYLVWHSQDARMYSMLLALIVASSWLALTALARNKWHYWVAYVLVTWLALHTHYSAAFVVLAQNLAIIGSTSTRRHWPALRRWLVGQVVLGLLYIPWLGLVGRSLSAYSGNGDSPGLWAMFYRSFSALAFGETLLLTLRPWLALLCGGLMLWGLIQLARSRTSRFAAWWLALALAVPLGATWLSAATRPIFNERYLVAAVPAVYLLLAAGMTNPAAEKTSREAHPRRVQTWVTSSALVVILVAMAGSLAGFYANPAYSKTHGWRLLAAALDRLAAGIPAGQVRIAENFPDPTLWYYYAGPVEHVMLPPEPKDAAGARQEVKTMAEDGVSRIILPIMQADNWDPSGIASEALAGEFQLIGRQQAGAWPVEVYARPDPAAPTVKDVLYTNGLLLRDAGSEPVATRPGGLLAVHLDWDGDPTMLKGSEKLFIHVTGPDGKPVAQIDVPLSLDRLANMQTFGIALPADLAPGHYAVLVGLYDPTQAAAPRLLTATGEDHVLVGEVDVAAHPSR